MHNPFTVITSLLAILLAPAVSALGVNCEGSGLCSGYHEVIPFMLNAASGLSDLQVFRSHEQIICFDSGLGGESFCLFLQGPGRSFTSGANSRMGISGAMVKDLLKRLSDHGCKGCGSQPLDYQSNNPANGILTSNGVGDAHGCNGICAVDAPFYLEPPTTPVSGAQITPAPGSPNGTVITTLTTMMRR